MALQKRTKISPENGMFKPLEKKRYSEQIAELIQDRILKDRIEIGTLLPTEKELAQEFQVSRSVIREALRVLEISGLVNIKKGPTGGIFVTDGYGKPIKSSLSNLITSGEVTMEHLFDVRMLIEPHIALQAALHATDEDIQKLRSLIHNSESHQNDSNRLKKNNLNFHLLLAKASGNPIFSILLESVLHILIEMSLDFRNLKLERYFFKIHKKIFEAIERSNAEEARELMEKDIQEIKQKLTIFKKKGLE